MVLSSLLPILALGLAASAAPATDPNKPYGDGWAEVTQCAYSLSLGYPTYDPNNALRWDPPIEYIGTIMQYHSTTAGNSMTIYSPLTQLNTTEYWPESQTMHCDPTKGTGSNYCFMGTFQATKRVPTPWLYLIGPLNYNTILSPNKQPATKVEAKSNAAQTLCLNKWSVNYVQTLRPTPPGGAIGSTYCTSKWDGTPLPQCPNFKSQTWTYINLPSSL